jgi:hypothetical protein
MWQAAAGYCYVLAAGVDGGCETEGNGHGRGAARGSLSTLYVEKIFEKKTEGGKREKREKKKRTKLDNTTTMEVGGIKSMRIVRTLLVRRCCTEYGVRSICAEACPVMIVYATVLALH